MKETSKGNKLGAEKSYELGYKNEIGSEYKGGIFQNRIVQKLDTSKARGFDPFLSPKEAAQYLGVSSRFIYERIATREMPSQPMGRLRRIRLSTLENWLIHQRNGEAL